MTPSSKLKRHLNGLQHHNIQDEQGVSAFDVVPCFRLTAMTNALRTLSKDLQFITASLPLATYKLKNVGINDITADSVAGFISNTMLASDA